MDEGVGRAGHQAPAGLDAVAAVATFYVVRHAKAGSRGHWSGDDRMRPLSKKGRQQAEDLVGVLEPFPVSAIFASPYVRCVQTVEPLARAHRLSIKRAASLAEGHGLVGLGEFFTDPKLDHAVLSTHGDLTWELVEDLVNRHVIKAGDGGYEKGSTWVVQTEAGVPVRARYLAAP